jgi:hypothetical protein
MRSLTVDQSADATTDLEAILKPQWNSLQVNYSLWHKVDIAL